MNIALIAPQAYQRGSHAGPADGQRPGGLAEALAGLGHTVTIYVGKRSSRQPSRTAVAPRVALERLPVGVDGDLGARIRGFSERLADRWRQSPPDVAHAHTWTAGLAALAGSRGLGVPVVQTVPGLRTAAEELFETAAVGGRRQKDPRLRLRVSLARHVDGVLATSSQALRQLAGYGVPRASMRVVPWGVDICRFAPEGPVARRTRRPRLLTVASLRPDQGVDTVIRALAEVPEAELLVVCQPGGDGQCRAALEKLGAELGVADRVRLTGEPADKDLPALLRSADLLVNAAWEEPFGTVALRAMACGTPVAASAVGCHQDAVIDGTTGMLVPPGQPTRLARRIRDLLASPLQLEAFGIAAADRVRARYSWDRIGQETLWAYRNCLGHDRAELDEVA